METFTDVYFRLFHGLVQFAVAARSPNSPHVPGGILTGAERPKRLHFH
jgi:hypothetical protein